MRPIQTKVALAAAVAVVLGSVLIEYHAGPVELFVLAAIGALAMVLIIGGKR